MTAIMKINWPEVTAYLNLDTGQLATEAGATADGDWTVRDIDVNSYMAAVRQSTAEGETIPRDNSPWAKSTGSSQTSDQQEDDTDA